MNRTLILLGALACGACSETAHFRGPATYTVSTPSEPPRSGAKDQSGLLCANMLAGKVVLRLADGCVLGASPSLGGHGAAIWSGQRCVLPLAEGARDMVVSSGSLVADASKGIDVTIGGDLVGAGGGYVAYRLNAGPPHMGGEGCDALLARGERR